MSKISILFSFIILIVSAYLLGFHNGENKGYIDEAIQCGNLMQSTLDYTRQEIDKENNK